MTFVILLYCHQTEKGKEWENNFNFQKCNTSVKIYRAKS